MSDLLNEDDRWQQHYDNAAEQLFGILPGGVTTPEQDEACCADADRRLADESVK